MSRRLRQYLAAGTAALVTTALYLPALRNGFVNWDDDRFIVTNPHFRSLDASFFRWAFTDYRTTGNWHPLTWLSYGLDRALWGAGPFGYHLSAVLLHAVVTFLAVIVTMRLVEAASLTREKAPAEATSFLDARTVLIAGAATGILFGLHPLHVETATWISDRRDLLCAAFYLLGIASYAGYATSPAGAVEGGRVRFFVTDRAYLVALLCMVLAGLSKSMVVTLPAVLLVLDWYPFGRLRSRATALRLVAEKAPFLLVGALLSGIVYVTQTVYNAVVPFDVLPLSERLPVAARSVLLYLGKLVVPADLSPFYPYPAGASLAGPRYLAMAGAIVAVTVLCIAAARKQKLYLAVWLTYLVALAPVSGIVQIGAHSMADRYAYLPSVAPLLLAGMGSAWVWRKAEDLRQRWGRLVRYSCIALACSALLVLSLMTVRQISLWKDSVRLWTSVIEREPEGVPLAYNNRGLAYRDLGRLDLAIDDLTKAIELAPGDTGFYNNRGSVYGAAGQDGLAMADFNRAIELDPRNAGAYTNRGLKYEEASQYEKALADLNRALALDPSRGDAYLNRGLTFENMGMLDRALSDYDRAVELDPTDYQARSYRAIVLGKQGKTDAAVAELTQVISASPAYADAYLYRGDLSMKAGDREGAREDYQAACERGSKAGCDAVIRMEGQRR